MSWGLGGGVPFFRTLDALVGTITRVAKLSVLRHVAVSTQGHQVPECIVTPLAPSDLAMNLKALQRPALPTPPPIPLQNPLHQPPIDLLPQLDGSDFLCTSVSKRSGGFAGEIDKSNPCPPKRTLGRMIG